MTRNRFVIDTNVPIAANGRNTHADEQCQLNCINFLDEIRTKSIVLLDNEDFLFDEYKKYLSFHGEPGVGDKFFKYL